MNIKDVFFNKYFFIFCGLVTVIMWFASFEAVIASVAAAFMCCSFEKIWGKKCC